MDLKEIVSKAKKQALDNNSIKKEILTYFDDPYLFDAMDELCKRDINRIEYKTSGTTILFSMYERNQGKYKISMHQPKTYLGKITIDSETLDVVSNDSDIFGIYEEGKKRENLLAMLKVLKSMPDKNVLKDLVARTLNNAL